MSDSISRREFMEGLLATTAAAALLWTEPVKWRAMPYIVFDHMPLAAFGNRIPNFDLVLRSDGDLEADDV